MTTTVLVIEDDRSVAQLLEDALEDAGYRVLLESDGEWGLRTFESKPVDLLIIDVLVPKLVGFDLIHRVRASEKGANVPIIVVSGVYRASVHRAKLIERYGILEYFDKPLDIDKLLYAARQVALVPPSGDLGPCLTIPPDVSAIDEGPAAVAATAVDIRPEPRGMLDEVPFARLLGQLFASRATGALLLRKSSMKKIVYLQNGLPVFVKSNLVNECLGRVMVRERLITEKECERSVERLKKEDRKQGGILVEMGCISAHNLEFALEQQLELKLFDVFSWLEGKYLFNDDQLYDGPAVSLPMAPTEMIYEGVRRTMSTARVYRDLAVFDPLIVAPADDPTFRYQALQLEHRAERMLDLVDGTQTVSEVLDGAGFARPDAAVLLYAVACTGLVRLMAEAAGARPEPPRLRLRQTPLALMDEDEITALTDELAPMEPEPKAITEARKKAREAAAEAVRTDDDVGGSEAIVARVEREAAELVAAALAAEAPHSEAEPPEVVTPALESEETEPGDELPEPDPRAARAQASLLVAPDDSLQTDADELPFGGQAAAEEAPSELPKVDVERARAELAARLATEAARLSGRNYYERLELHRHASKQEIERAYKARQKAHHPDHITAGVPGRALRARAEEVFLMIRRAYETLVDDAQRAHYDATLVAAESAEVQSDIAASLAAEAAFVRGQALTEAGDWREAIGELQSAADLNPAEAAYLAHLAWARFCSSPEEPEIATSALEMLDAAVDLRPDLEEAHVFAGLIQDKIGHRDAAVLSLRRAVECNPDSVRALRALRTLAPAPPKRPSLFSRLGV